MVNRLLFLLVSLSWAISIMKWIELVHRVTQHPLTQITQQERKKEKKILKTHPHLDS